MDIAYQKRIAVMVEEYFEGSITPERLAKLDMLLQSDVQARRVYLEYVYVNMGLRRYLGHCEYLHIEEEQSKEKSLEFNSALVNLLSEEKFANAVELQQQQEQPTETIVEKVEPRQIKRKPINKSGIIPFISALAAVLMLVFFIGIYGTQSHKQVATITSSYNAEFAWSNSKVKNGLRLTDSGEILELTKGLAELEFDNGVKLVVEAPSSFQILTDDRIGVIEGSVYASVPPQAIGFTVYSHNTKIIDMGTEFGVRTNSDGDTMVQVTKGKTFVVAYENDQVETQSVFCGQAKRIEFRTKAINEIPYVAESFVRAFDGSTGKQWKGVGTIDLADIVGGGNGFGTGLAGAGVEPLSGKFVSSFSAEHEMCSDRAVFNPVPDNRFIDGVFVPNGKYDFAITSYGHSFAQCPETNGCYWAGIQNGALFYHANAINKHVLSLGGKKVESNAIFIHANQGITFDLDKIRELVKDKNCELTRFTAACGVSDSIFDDSVYADGVTTFFTRDQIDLPNSDFWVIVDGVKRFDKVKQSPVDSPENIDIPISDSDRFLTIMVTDHNGDLGHAWSLLAEPELRFESY